MKYILCFIFMWLIQLRILHETREPNKPLITVRLTPQASLNVPTNRFLSVTTIDSKAFANWGLLKHHHTCSSNNFARDIVAHRALKQ